MKAVIAIDSLKGSLSSLEAGKAVAEGILRAVKDAEVSVHPLADGGEGTVEALVQGMNGSLHSAKVTGPLGDPVACPYGILPDNRTAVLEMAGAAGLTLVPAHRRNPLKTTTYGLGEAIKDAIGNGCRRFIIGIGGSATNDGGAGMLQALGFEFLDKAGSPIPPGAEGLKDLAEIRTASALPELRECSFRIACDVTNPLCGPEGCSAIFGPQKGADARMIRNMDRWLMRYAGLAAQISPKADRYKPGTGAAGGLGFAFLSFTNAVLESGIKIVLEETRLEEAIRTADYVITGEGRLDAQTAMGKAPIGVASLARRYRKPVIALAGSVTDGAAACNQAGIDAYFPILRTVTTLEEAMDPVTAYSNLASAAEQAFRLIAAVENKSIKLKM